MVLIGPNKETAIYKKGLIRTMTYNQGILIIADVIMS